MSNGKHETIADIVAALRAIAYIQTAESPSSVLSFANRIESAAKREREAGAEAAQICGEIGEMIGRDATCKETVTDCHGLGNAAAMREALEELRDIVHNAFWSKDGTVKGDVLNALRRANVALAKPPRNCDIMDWRTAWAKWVGLARLMLCTPWAMSSK